MNLLMAEWHIITSEYPPQLGGVSDYTHLVASGLAAAGDKVHVWCPPVSGDTPREPGVVVHRDLGSISSADLRRVGRELNQYSEPRRLLVQWVPHGYGYRSMNLPFCLWLWERAARHRDHIEVMVHEPFLVFGEGSWRQNAVAVVHRLMTIALLRAARRVWISIPYWESCLRPYALGRKLSFDWLPISSTVPVVDDPYGVSLVRNRFAPENEHLITHFGTYGRHMSDLLMSLVPLLLSTKPGRSMFLLGRGGEAVRDRLIQRHPDLAGRVHATGILEAADVSRHLSACDLMIQPFTDGISTRRTSVMAGLSHGLPIVTTTGHNTESFWAETSTVALAPAGDIAGMARTVDRLLADESERIRAGRAGRALYQNRFHVSHIVAALRGTEAEGLKAGSRLVTAENS